MKRFLSALEPFKAEIEGVAVESTFNWYWLVDGLMDAGYRVHLVNTAAVKQYEGLKHSLCWQPAPEQRQAEGIRQYEEW